MSRRFVAAAVLALALIGCGGLSAGRIADTRFEPEHDETYQSYEITGYERECHMIGKIWSCDMEPQYGYVTRCCRHIPDRWFVRIEGNCTSPDGNGVVKCDTDWKEVTEDFYNAAVDGRIKWFGPTPGPK